VCLEDAELKRTLEDPVRETIINLNGRTNIRKKFEHTLDTRTMLAQLRDREEVVNTTRKS